VRKTRPAKQKPPQWDIIYSRDLVTPHIKWADPYVNGPIRAFFISSVHEGRTVVELMQRLSLEPRAVSIDPHWDVNRWSVDRYYADFEDREPKDYEPSYRVLEAELAASARYDVLVMHSILGWNHMPAKIRQMIQARVKAGEGLVLVHPQLGEDETDKSLWQVSPIVGVEATKLTGAGAGIDEGYPRVPPTSISGAAWQKAADHFVVDGIPFEALPYPALQHYRYRLGAGAQALATGEGGAPVVAAKEYGKGRVVGLAYHNYALFPQLKARRGELNENFWEYLFSLLMRSIVWAARKEPQVRLRAVDPAARRYPPGKPPGAVTLHLSNAGPAARARVTVTLRDLHRNLEGEAVSNVSLPGGGKEVSVPLPQGAPASGRHFIDVMVRADGKQQDWGTGTYEVRQDARVVKVMPSTEAVAAGATLAGHVKLAGRARGMTLVSELWDLAGRLLSQQSQQVRGTSARFRLVCPEALSNLGWVKCRLMDGGRLVSEAEAQVALTAPRRRWEDYEVVLPWLHGGVWPWTGLIEDQYRKAGITSTSDPAWNFSLTVSMHPPGFGIYWFRRHAYLERKKLYGQAKDRKYLARVPCIHSDEFRKPVADALRKGIPPILKYSPLAYFIADESSITCYEDAFDLCWGDATLAEFRKWLKRQYRSLDALNAEWGTRYQSWEKAMPVTWEEAQRRGNPAPWVDHRLFMSRTLATAFEYARDVARRVDPDGLVTVSGTQIPGSHNGCDWSQIDKIIEYLQPYDGGGQLEMHRSFNPSMILTGFTGYSLFGEPLEHQIWHRFFHSHHGASIFWGYTVVDPDLTLNAQGSSMEKTFGELRGEGICRAIMGLRRQHDKIGIHFSMASGHVWWIQDGKLTYQGMEYGTRTSPSFSRFIRNREGWTWAIEDAGYQCDYVAYDRIERGELAELGFKALVLPGSIALSEKEAAQIRAFVGAGGLLIADVQPGLTDGHGRKLARGALDDVFAAPRYGRGRAVTLNQWFDTYPKARFKAEGEKLRESIRVELERARILPRAVVESANGRHPVAVERVSWRGGPVEVVGLLRETAGEFKLQTDGTLAYQVRKGVKPAESVRVALPQEGHWYDLRAHKHLGKIGEIRTSLRGADPKLYAMLPYEVKGITLSLTGGKRGEATGYQVKLKIGAARPVRQVIKIEVSGPDGSKPLYSRNIDAQGGVGRGSFRLALNDTPGVWRVRATDVFSGATAEKALLVRGSR
jgi:hypothetical protein